MATHYIKRNDIARKVTDILTLNGAAINLTGCTLSWIMRNRATGVAIKQTATIVTAATGSVEYQFVTGDTATAGVYDCEWEIVYTTGSKPLTVPDDGYIVLEILEDLG